MFILYCLYILDTTVLNLLFHQAKTSYRWVIEHRSDGQNTDILLQIHEGSSQYSSGNLVINEQIREAGGLAGGRLGVYTHSQEDVTWSNMKTNCL